MPLVPHVPQFIEVEVADRVYGGTILKQKARFMGMNIEQNVITGVANVLVRLRVFLYAESNGGYGGEIVGKGISTYDVSLVADNNCAVDVATGEVKYIRINEPEDVWLQKLADAPETLMLQGDFFEVLMHSAPVEIEPMLRNFMLQANQAPFNKFV